MIRSASFLSATVLYGLGKATFMGPSGEAASQPSCWCQLQNDQDRQWLMQRWTFAGHRLARANLIPKKRGISRLEKRPTPVGSTGIR